MITLAYNIDPLLQELPRTAAQSLLDAIPDLALSIPDCRHLAITHDETLNFEAGTTDPPLDLARLKIKARFWENPATARKNALARAFQANQVRLWFTTDPGSVLPGQPVKSLLLSSARSLLSRQYYPQKRFSQPGVPNWTHAAAIIVPHHHDREALISIFPQLEKTVNVIYPALEEPVLPLSWAEQEQLKMRYSGGRDFFLYAGDLSESQDLIHLLKSYSLVKKWLMTGMPLIMAGPATDWTARLEKMLLTYKYRVDVSVYPDISQTDLKELVAGAYVLVNPGSSTTDAFALQWAFSAGTPVIASQSKDMSEFCKEAAQLSPAGDTDQLAHAMMILYKDEYLRSNLITKGKERAESLNRLNTLQQYKAVIMGLLQENS
ncbi:glycosyltransferase [Flavihumibacter fluvii]|uniref:glycosyltransferase n=1 Tax=Flavihumibacter fluvii TaxID=2838157 RepID=UPI001BDE3594|nr:glycosyltransferase [Flavihumibacter fluvii]ULQ52260.1 glycosyltransferase [Flavihumibacter fluvii]